MGIKNENWYAASKDLGATALRLYLYLASNANGYNLALSPAAIQVDIGMPRSTYHDQFKVLIDKGYLVETKGNHFEFYETPQPRTVATEESVLPTDVLNFEECPSADMDKPANDKVVLREDTEIDNMPITDTVEINNESLTSVDNIKKPEVKEIVIKRPEVNGKKKPLCIEKTKREEFIF